MGKSLVVVESPAKAKTINKLLGKDFLVMASIGHVKDLPKSKLGVDIEKGFTPEYVTIRGKAKTIGELKKAGKKSDNIYLASDPDREGEAIAWHIAEEVGGNVHRVLFNEITAGAVKEAIKHPVKLDRDKFEAQQARRILDRLVGYQVSPLLWDKVRRGLSAGRVQSVAMRLICERERAIEAFNPKEYWSVTAAFEEPDFEAKLVKKDGKKLEIGNGDDATGIVTELKALPFDVESVVKKERRRFPTAPFTTSKLQQEASRRLGFTAKKTMMVAQQLYEGVEIGSEGPVGLITYMRTDSTRISNEAITAAREYISANHGPEFLPEKPNIYKSKKGAQDAHEAIRPTYFNHDPASIKSHLSRDQWRLYQIIWNRLIASQMTPAVLDQTKVSIKAGQYTLQANGSVMKFRGFMVVYVEGTDGEAEKEEGLLPPLEEGDKLPAPAITPLQHFTQPPPRFTEATLVKELEENGIGRPSTYAATLSTIQDREYARKDKKQFTPTELGFTVTDLLVESFPTIFSVEFTAKMEEELDQIAEGKTDWVGSMKNFYGPFKESLEKAKTGMKNLKAEEVPTDIECDKCGKKMVIKWGRNGKFLACPGYPDCKNTKDFKTDGGKVVVVEKTEEVCGECPKCGKPMLAKSGRYGRFLACSDYPACKTTKPYTTGVKCKNDGCDGDLVERRTKKGRVFFSCSKYPDCDYATWKLPTDGDKE